MEFPPVYLLLTKLLNLLLMMWLVLIIVSISDRLQTLRDATAEVLSYCRSLNSQPNLSCTYHLESD